MPIRDIKIAVTGELRSGKSTVTDYLTSAFYAIPFAFGDQLKDDYHKLFPSIPRDPKPRAGYQHFGQMQRFKYGEDYWLDKCLDEIHRQQQAALAYNTPDNALDFITVISDLRQPNEYARLREEGYTIIRVESTPQSRISRAQAAGDHFTLEDTQHDTELHASGFDVDYVVSNNGSLIQLYKQINDIMDVELNKEWRHLKHDS